MRIEKPYRQKRTGTIEVAAAPDDVFALMCPVREYEWEPGWTTNVILSESGLVEENCIFTTPAGASEGSANASREAIWMTPIHDMEKRRLMMIKITPDESVMRLDIRVEETENGATVTTTYEHTAIAEAGRAIVDAHTAERFDDMMQRWTGAIEACLAEEGRRCSA